MKKWNWRAVRAEMLRAAAFVGMYCVLKLGLYALKKLNLRLPSTGWPDVDVYLPGILIAGTYLAVIAGVLIWHRRLEGWKPAEVRN